MRTVVSVINHGHGKLLSLLLSDLNEFCSGEDLKIVITNNVCDEDLVISDTDFDVQVVNNLRPRGFGANHNSVFNNNYGEFFCILNPDIRLNANPFEVLRSQLDVAGSGVTLPLVLNSLGKHEVSVRKFPTPATILGKLFGRNSDAINTQSLSNTVEVDWGGGMCMLFNWRAYREVCGFDETFFLYYEDVDICGRMWLGGKSVLFCPRISVVHDGQRTSHSNLKFFFWHLTSMLRYFLRSRSYINSRL